MDAVRLRFASIAGRTSRCGWAQATSGERLFVMRSFTTSSRSAARPFRRVVFISTCGAVAAGHWYLNRDITPADAEELALKHEKHREEELARISRKISWWRLFELFVLAMPLAFISPLWLLSPTLFWKIVAMQIDRSGPCFIKLAQWLSTRRDIFSDELCECLSVMHERVEAVWSEGVSPKEILNQLGKSDLQIRQIDDEAIASGSIAQVYFGELEDGTQVAVKCLRPSVRDILESDLAWLLYIGNVADRSPKFAVFNLGKAAEDFCEHVQMQVDFEIEGNNLQRFRKNFANSGEAVRFPKPLFVSKEILVLTREKGDNLAQVFRAANDVAHSRRETEPCGEGSSSATASQPGAGKLQARYCSQEEMDMLSMRSRDIQEVLAVPASTIRKLSAEVMACYMRMVFNDAFIHGDLHPGNIMIRLNEGAFEHEGGLGWSSSFNVGGWKHHVSRFVRRFMPDPEPDFEVVLLDAGLAIPIAPKRVEALRAMAVCMLYCDFIGSATHIYNASPDSSKCTDPEAFIDALANVFIGVRKHGSEAGYVQVSDACLECLRLVRHHQVHLDTGLTWALFAMLSVEGSARQLDPLTDCTTAAARYTITVPSLFREMKHQSPDILWKMVHELVYGRPTHHGQNSIPTAAA